MAKFLKSWLAVFVVLFLLDLVWHLVIAGHFYGAQLVGTQRYNSDGGLAPLIPFVVLSDIFVSFGYTALVGAASAASGKYILNGLIAGVVIVGSYSILNHAILPNWPLGVVAVDLVQGIIFGLVIGAVLKKLRPNAL